MNVSLVVEALRVIFFLNVVSFPHNSGVILGQYVKNILPDTSNVGEHLFDSEGWQ